MFDPCIAHQIQKAPVDIDRRFFLVFRACQSGRAILVLDVGGDGLQQRGQVFLQPREALVAFTGDLVHAMCQGVLVQTGILINEINRCNAMAGRLIEGCISRKSMSSLLDLLAFQRK